MATKRTVYIPLDANVLAFAEKRMEKTGLSQRQLAFALGTDPQRISGILHGHRVHPFYVSLDALASALQVAKREILKIPEEVPTN